MRDFCPAPGLSVRRLLEPGCILCMLLFFLPIRLYSLLVGLQITEPSRDVIASRECKLNAKPGLLLPTGTPILPHVGGRRCQGSHFIDVTNVSPVRCRLLASSSKLRVEHVFLKACAMGTWRSVYRPNE